MITLGALLGTTILYFSGAERQAAEVGFRSVQSRALAWSGVQAAMAELDTQREALLQGAQPALTESWLAQIEEPGEVTSGPRWGFRLMRLGDVVAEPQMAKLDANSATPEMFARLSGVSKELANAIVAARKTRRFTSLSDLLAVPGMTPQLLFDVPTASGASPEGEPSGGESPRSTSTPSDASPTAPSDASDPLPPAPPSDAGANATDVPPARTRPLADFLTVFSYDPEVQLGYGAHASEVRGNQRINLNVEWSEALGQAIERRFDKGVADGVRGLLTQGRKFNKPSDIVKTLREFRIKPTEWAEVLDAFTTSSEEYRLGTMDLNTAPVEVLACIPGVTRESAAEIVFRRARLDEELRRTVAWPAIEGVLTEDDFEKAVDYLATRCLQWRVVIEAGVLPESSGGAGEGLFADRPQWEGLGGAGGGGESEGELSSSDFIRAVDGRAPELVTDRIVLEAIIDVSARRPRVALLRDVSHLALAARLKATRTGRDESPSEAEPASPAPAPNPETDEAPAPDPDSPSATPADEGHDLDLPDLEGNDLNLGGSGDGPGKKSTKAKSASTPTSAPASTPAAPSAPADRRVGRWTTNAAGGNR